MKKQFTIIDSIIIRGKAWYSGKNCSVECHPSTDGITVEYKGIVKRLKPNLININANDYTTLLNIGGAQIRMVEHLFSALNGLEIDNVHIKFNSEDVPFCASSELFTNEILKVGLSELSKFKEYIAIKNEIKIIDGDKICIIAPSKKFSIDTVISFDNIIGKQTYEYSAYTDYRSEVSNARSFLIFEI
ncbi:MAG TPA: UDP-3-O-acyl-N-acetylglucosamine deacetylase, partial [Clostridia bacterium]